MYSEEANMFKLVKRQFLFKLRAHISTFISLFAVQIIGLLICFSGGSSSWTAGGNTYSIEAKILSTDIIFILTVFWAFIISIIYTGAVFKSYDFALIPNRLVQFFSSTILILFQCIIASLTTIGTGILFLVITYFSNNNTFISWENFYVSFKNFLFILIIAFLYYLLASALGFLIGTLAQFYRPFIFFIPMFFIGILIAEQSSFNTASFILYFVHESSGLLFAIKSVATSGIFFCCALLLSTRLEVKDI